MRGSLSSGSGADERAEAMAQELAAADAVPEPDETVIEVKPGLVEWVQEQILQRKARTALDQILVDLERELKEEDRAAAMEAEGDEASEGAEENEGSIAALATPEIESLAAATLDSGAPDVPERRADAEDPESEDEP